MNVQFSISNTRALTLKGGPPPSLLRQGSEDAGVEDAGKWREKDMVMKKEIRIKVLRIRGSEGREKDTAREVRMETLRMQESKEKDTVENKREYKWEKEH